MERLALPLAYLAMEAAWIGGVAAVGGQAYAADRRPALPLPVVLATLLVGYAAGRALLRREAGEGGSRGWVWLSLALGCLWSMTAVWLGRHPGGGAAWIAALPQALVDVWQGLSPDVAGLACALFAWWRGQGAGAAPPDHPATVRSFGVGAMALSAALGSAAAGLGTPAAASFHALLFLAAGLPALSLARLREVQRDLEAGVARGNTVRFGGGWWRTLTPPVAAVLVIAVLAAVALGDEGLRRALLGGLAALGMALWNVLYWPLLAIGYVAELLVNVLRRLPQRPAGEQQAPPGGELLEQLRATATSSPDPRLVQVIQWAALALVIAGLLATFLLTTRLSRREPPPERAAGEERESLWSWRDAWRSLRTWLAGLLHRWLARGRGPAGEAPGGSGWLGAGSASAGDVRAAYRRLLALGRAGGLPRAQPQTPHEYLGAWRERLPGAAEAGEVTQAYTEVRYGRPVPPRAPARRLSEALSRLSHLLARKVS